MSKKIICDINYAGGEHFPIGETKIKLWEMLDNEFTKDETVYLTLNSSLQLLVVDYYAIKNDCVLEVKIPTETNGFKVVSGENLCEAHYYLNKEYIDLENEYEFAEDEAEEEINIHKKNESVLYQELKKDIENNKKRTIQNSISQNKVLNKEIEIIQSFQAPFVLFTTNNKYFILNYKKYEEQVKTDFKKFPTISSRIVEEHNRDTSSKEIIDFEKMFLIDELNYIKNNYIVRFFDASPLIKIEPSQTIYNLILEQIKIKNKDFTKELEKELDQYE